MENAARTNGGDDTIRFHLVHAVRGRTRMRVDSPQQLDALVQAIEDFFRDHPGLREIRANRDCQSVVVTYDPELLDAGPLVVTTEREETSPDSWLRTGTLLADDLVARAADAGHMLRQTIVNLAPPWLRWPARAQAASSTVISFWSMISAAARRRVEPDPGSTAGDGATLSRR